MTHPKRKILIGIGSTNVFGAERRFLKLVRSILKDDHLSNVILALNSTLYKKSLESPFSETITQLRERKCLVVIPDRFSHLSSLLGAGLLVRALLSKDVTFHLVLHARLLAIPRILIGKQANVEVTSPDVAEAIAHNFPKFIIKKVHSFTFVSETVRDLFLKALGQRGVRVRPSQIHVWSAPYYEDHGPSSTKKQKAVVSASRFIERKNVALFAQCIKDIHAELPGWKFYFLGKGPLEQEIKDLLKVEIEAGKVFVGYVSDVSNYLNRSQVFVSLIEPDNYPSQGILEAMSLENALLLSDTGKSKLFINELDANGYCVPLNKEAISSALLKLCNEESLTLTMGHKSRKHLEIQFGVNVFFNEFMQLTATPVDVQQTK